MALEVNYGGPRNGIPPRPPSFPSGEKTNFKKWALVIVPALAIIVGGIVYGARFLMPKSDVSIEEARVKEAQEKATAVAPATTTYAFAVKAGVPYRCVFGVPKLFGSTQNKVVADILGGDFIATETDIDFEGEPYEEKNEITYARKGNMAYSWSAERGNYSMDVAEVERALAPYFGENYEHPGDFVFVAPPKDASCERVNSVTITIPNIEFKNLTREMVADYVRSAEGELKQIAELPFTALLMDYDGYKATKHIFDDVETTNEISLAINLRSDSELYWIQQTNPANPEESFTKCFSGMCSPVMTTQKGRAIYSETKQGFLDRGGREIYIVYHVLIDGTAVSFYRIEIAGGKKVPLSNERLQGLVDSFRRPSPKEFLNIENSSIFH